MDALTWMRSGVTVLSMVIFFAVVWMTFRKANKSFYEQAGAIPLQEDDDLCQPTPERSLSSCQNIERTR